MQKLLKSLPIKKTGTSKKASLPISCNIHHLAFDNAAQANIVSKVSNGKIIIANNAACKLLGYSKKELLTKSNAVIFDEKKSSFKKMLVQRSAEGQSTAVATAIKKNGKLIPCQITSAVFIDGSIKKSITTLVDISKSILKQKDIDTKKEKIVAENIAFAITKQKNIDSKKEKLVADEIFQAKVKAEARLTENNDWLKYINKTSNDVICDRNLLTNELVMSDGFEELFGYSIKNNKNITFDKTDYIHPDDKDAFENGLQKAIQSSSSYWEHIYRFIRADGSIANVFERANIIRLTDGKACRIIGVMQDISRQKQNEDDLGKLGIRKNLLVEKIKNIIQELIHYSNEQLQINFSEHLSKTLEYDYTYLANLFSEMETMPIQKYIIIQKIERVKQLTLDDELTLTEIAWKLHYSSVAHLSNQFKKVTGLTPSLYKQQKNNSHATLQNV